MLRSIFKATEYDELVRASMQVRYESITKEDLLQRELVLFGAGCCGKLVLDALLASGIKPAWIADNDESLHGKNLSGVIIKSPESLRGHEGKFVLLASSHMKSMSMQCESLGVSTWILPSALSGFQYTPGELGLSVDELNKNSDVLECYNILSDKKSMKVFQNLIKFHCCSDTSLYKMFEDRQYFASDIHKMIDYSHFVDAGAYVGDTLQDWVNKYECTDQSNFSYHAFEPESRSYAELQRSVSRLPIFLQNNIRCYNAGLAAKEYFANLSLTDGAASFAINNSHEQGAENTIQLMALDDAKLSNVTMIKADIEGFEMDLLEGAVETIRKFRPALALCVYHKKLDFVKIPLWVHQLGLDYTIYLRHHSDRSGETVCYAIPRNG